MRRLAIWLLLGVLTLATTGLGGYLMISLLVERNPEVEIPDLTGLELSEALDKLGGTGLDLEVRGFVYSDQVAENRIVRQRPEPGRRVKAGRGVGVTLSRGPERRPVPSVAGLPLEDARIRLEEAGLETRIGARIHDGPEEQVVAQSFDPGARLARGTEVAVVTSKGRRPVRLRMPRVEGRSAEAALAELDRLGLQVGRIEELKLNDPILAGRVMSQSPLAGFPVQPSDEVNLTVVGTLRQVLPPQGTLFWSSLPPGYVRHRVEVTLELKGREWRLYDDWLIGGTNFELWVPLYPGESATLRVDGNDVQMYRRP